MTTHRKPLQPGTGFHLATWLLVVTILMTGCVTPSAALVQSKAYVEPGLLSTAETNVSVIVTATSAQKAAQAVRRIGGTLTSDLWLINAVAATIPAASLGKLAANPAIRSVVANQTVVSAEAPVNAGSGWDGYVSKRMLRRAGQVVGGTALVGLAALDNGGAAALGNDGSLVFFAADGAEQKRSKLAGNSFPYAPVAEGGLVLVSAGARLSAFNNDGTLRWEASVSSNAGYTSQATVAADAVYVAVGQHWVYAYNRSTGQDIWRTKVDGTKLGTAAGRPTAGADGTVYVAYTGEGSGAIGKLYAFNGNGSVKYQMTGDASQPFGMSPLASANGTVYVASKKRIYALNGDGTVRFRFDLPDEQSGLPVLGADGALFVSVKADLLVAINADGSRRFEFRTGGTLETAPALAPDGSRVYVARKEKQLFALNAANGATLWSYTTLGDIGATPAVSPDGSLHVGDLLGNYAILDPDGTVSTRMTGFTPLARSVVTTADGSSFIPGTTSVSNVGKLPKQWNGRADVKNIGAKKVWDLVNPFVIDIGADQMHSHVLPSGKPVDGSGVTVAVLDSGVYFDDQVKAELGSVVEKLFLGQADFMQRQCDTYQKDKKIYTLGLQYQSHCFTGPYNSKDAYGHGTHVAGAVWNNMTDQSSGVFLGVAPAANILSVRVLDGHGNGTYADAIEGIQYIVQNKDYFGIRVLNMSISARPTTPYFVDPLNRAVMQAWAAGITVVAAAGNVGPLAESVTVPGNNPYVITVGAVNSQRTPGYWTGDIVPRWSAAGPTFDGFLKPDVLAPGSQIVSFMYNDHLNNTRSAQLVREHPDYSGSISLFRMNGTSMATAVTSGVVALMLQAKPGLTPNQVKYRLLESSLPAINDEAAPIYNILQQGRGRIWAPAAVMTNFPADAAANQGMNIQQDLSYGFASAEESAMHYQGPARKMLSDDGATYLYYITGPDSQVYGLGMADAQTGAWLDAETIGNRLPTWSGGSITLSSGMNWAGGLSMGAGIPTWSGRLPTWSGGMALWSGGMPLWSGGMALWSGNTDTWAGRLPTWSGGMNWAGGLPTWSGGMALWSGGMPTWSGGMALWSGGMALWSGGLAWANSLPTWSGGMALWSGGLPTWSGSTWAGSAEGASMKAADWVDDEDAYESGGAPSAPSSTPSEPAPVQEATPTPAPAPAPASIQTSSNTSVNHIHTIVLDNYSYWANKKSWTGAFGVRIADQAGSSVAGALVTMDIFDGSSRLLSTVQCTTNQQGSCLITSQPQRSDRVSTMRAVMRDITLNGYLYDSTANRDPEGDSDGTSITAHLPSPSLTSSNVPQALIGSSTRVAMFDIESGADDTVDNGTEVGVEDNGIDVLAPEQTIRLFLPAVSNR